MQSIRRSVLFIPLMVCMFSSSPTAHTQEAFSIDDGDRIVFIGGTFVEREVRYGCIETVFTHHFYDKNLTFRNLGWSGDNVGGLSRASFDSPQVGYERLVKHAHDAKPTVILLQAGQNESFQGAKGLDAFREGLNGLLDDLKSTDARIVLLSPTLQENMGPPLPDPAAHNADLRTYAKAVQEIAKSRKLHFIDLITLLPVSNEITSTPRTDNGLHFTEAGYWQVAQAVLKGLGYQTPPPDEKVLAPLREIILEKNRLFINKWRPQNETYIHGFRKHEQGQHAAEIPLFDPLIAEQEARIARVRLAIRGIDQP